MPATKKSTEIAVSKEMLYHVRSELKADITTLRLETQSGFKKVYGSLENIVSTINRLDKKYETALERSDEKQEAAFARSDKKFQDTLDKSDKKFQATLDESNKKFQDALDKSDKKHQAASDKSDKKYQATLDRFNVTDTRLASNDLRTDGFEKVIVEFRAQFDSINAKLSEQNSKSHQMLLLLEEQRNENRYVLDGYASLNHRVEKLENPI